MRTHTQTIRRVDPTWLGREIGKRIRALRKKRGLTQEDVGLAVGVSRACVNNWELGRAQVNWNLTALYNVALFFKVPVRSLLP